MSPTLARAGAALLIGASAFGAALAVLHAFASAPTHCPDLATGPASDRPVFAPKAPEHAGLRR